MAGENDPQLNVRIPRALMARLNQWLFIAFGEPLPAGEKRRFVIDAIVRALNRVRAPEVDE